MAGVVEGGRVAGHPILAAIASRWPANLFRHDVAKPVHALAGAAVIALRKAAETMRQYSLYCAEVRNSSMRG